MPAGGGAGAAALGASDSMGTLTISDDTVPAYSSTGSNARSVDVVAPGTHLVSLRVPCSYIDQQHGATGHVTDELFRGSGTSQAAAFVAGAAALAIQQHPTITPDRLKKLMLASTTGLSGFSAQKQGQGEINLFELLTHGVFNPPKAWDRIAWSSGMGSLDASRGTDRLTDDGVVLSGEIDIFGHPFNSAAMAIAEAAGNSWSGGTWNGNTWSGNTWSGNTWSGNTWSGNTWGDG